MRYTEYSEGVKMRKVANRLTPIGRKYFETYKHVRIDDRTIELRKV